MEIGKAGNVSRLGRAMVPCYSAVMRLRHCNNVMDFRRIAKRRLPAPVFHYLDGGADDEVTLARNTTAFDDYELLPSQLSDASRIETRATLFGQPVDDGVLDGPSDHRQHD